MFVLLWVDETKLSDFFFGLTACLVGYAEKPPKNAATGSRFVQVSTEFEKYALRARPLDYEAPDCYEIYNRLPRPRQL
jgi:hypothetical protein